MKRQANTYTELMSALEDYDALNGHDPQYIFCSEQTLATIVGSAGEKPSVPYLVDRGHRDGAVTPPAFICDIPCFYEEMADGEVLLLTETEANAFLAQRTSQSVTIDWTEDPWLQELAKANRLDITKPHAWKLAMTTFLLTDVDQRNTDVSTEVMAKAGRRCIDWMREDISTGMTEDERVIADFVTSNLESRMDEEFGDR
jgi:hypothetical protein